MFYTIWSEDRVVLKKDRHIDQGNKKNPEIVHIDIVNRFLTMVSRSTNGEGHSFNIQC